MPALRLAREFGIHSRLGGTAVDDARQGGDHCDGSRFIRAPSPYGRGTRHRAALIQLVTSAIVFALTGLDEVGRVLDDYGMPRLLDLVRLRISLALHVIYVACLIALPAALYLVCPQRKTHLTKRCSERLLAF